MKKLVQGVGINDRKYPAYKLGKAVKEYSLWSSMLKRCYSEKVHIARPTYLRCSVSNNFKLYSYFYEWANNQIGFNTADYTLDKDLLIKANKIYSEDNCVFIPQKLNNLIIKSNGARGILPIGVCARGSKFQAYVGVEGIKKHLGFFDSPELAFNAYKTFKETHIKELAEKYKGTIDPRAYQALLNYEVNIDD